MNWMTFANGTLFGVVATLSIVAALNTLRSPQIPAWLPGENRGQMELRIETAINRHCRCSMRRYQLHRADKRNRPFTESVRAGGESCLILPGRSMFDRFQFDQGTITELESPE